MAKKYDTKEDFERDKLDEQAKDLRLRAEQQANMGNSLIVLSFLPHIISKTPRWLSWIASVAGIAGIIGVVRSWRTGGKAHDLELARERMGPQRVVLPDEMPETPEADCGCKYSAMLEPKSHSDYAAKSGVMEKT